MVKSVGELVKDLLKYDQSFPVIIETLEEMYDIRLTFVSGTHEGLTTDTVVIRTD